MNDTETELRKVQEAKAVLAALQISQPSFDAYEAKLRLEMAAPDLLAALKLQQAAFDELFAHCLSNGVFNAWGKPMDCTKLNQAQEAVNAAIAKAEKQ